MIDAETMANLQFAEYEYDIYEEDGHIFGCEFDLFNNQKYFYYKTIRKNGTEYYQYLDGDIYEAIKQFNAILDAVG